MACCTGTARKSSSGTWRQGNPSACSRLMGFRRRLSTRKERKPRVTRVSLGLRPGATLQVASRPEVPKGARTGAPVGRVALRVAGSFTVGNADGINAKRKLLHRTDRYNCAPRLLSGQANAPAGAFARRFWRFVGWAKRSCPPPRRWAWRGKSAPLALRDAVGSRGRAEAKPGELPR
jgi:hypothetical protein